MITSLMLKSLDIASIFQVDHWNRPVLYNRKKKKFVVESKLLKLVGWGFIYFMRNVLSFLPAVYIAEAAFHDKAHFTLTQHAVWINAVIAVGFLNCSDIILLIHRKTFAEAFKLLRELEKKLRKGDIFHEFWS